jgi:hypothetical protein
LDYERAIKLESRLLLLAKYNPPVLVLLRLVPSSPTDKVAKRLDFNGTVPGFKRKSRGILKISFSKSYWIFDTILTNI